MIDEEQQSKEKDFNGWLDSISFIDENGNVMMSILNDDVSDDPEDDRG